MRAQSRSPEKSRDKTKAMRAQSRSPEKSRDKTRRAKSEMRGGSHERRRKDRSRSKSPELKHRARHKEKNPVAEEVMAKSVSIGRQQITWDNPQNPRQRTETVGGATQEERTSRCERCSTYKGVKIQNTHEGTCHAARLKCRHCQKQGHLALACWDKYQIEKEDQTVGSKACFFCDTVQHEWRHCPYSNSYNKKPEDWPVALRSFYNKKKTMYARRRDAHIPQYWKKLNDLVTVSKREREQKASNLQQVHETQKQRDHHRREHPQEEGAQSSNEAAEGHAKYERSPKKTEQTVGDPLNLPDGKAQVARDDPSPPRQDATVQEPPPITPPDRHSFRQRSESFSSDSSDKSDLRVRVDEMHLTRKNHPPSPPTSPPRAMNKRKREDDSDTRDDAPTNGDRSQPTGDGLVQMGFIRTEALDLNGHMIGVIVPVYKRRKGGMSGNQDPSIDQVFELHPGYKVVQLRRDGDDTGGQ